MNVKTSMNYMSIMIILCATDLQKVIDLQEILKATSPIASRYDSCLNLLTWVCGIITPAPTLKNVDPKTAAPRQNVGTHARAIEKTQRWLLPIMLLAPTSKPSK